MVHAGVVFGASLNQNPTAGSHSAASVQSIMQYSEIPEEGQKSTSIWRKALVSLALIGALAGVAVVGNNVSDIHPPLCALLTRPFLPQAHKFSKSSSSSSTTLEAKSFPKYVKEFDVTSSDDKVFAPQDPITRLLDTLNSRVI